MSIVINYDITIENRRLFKLIGYLELIEDGPGNPQKKSKKKIGTSSFSKHTIV
jgi:hypothetical protein